MEFQRIVFGILLFFAESAGVFGEEKVDLSDLICDMPACSKIAEPKEYKAESLKHSITLKTGLFYLQVPDDPISRIVSSDRDIIIYYKNGEQLLVGEDPGPDVSGLKNLKVNQLPEMVFTKTAKDAEPEWHADRFFWRVALYQKPAYFDQASEVTYAENNGVSYFVSNSAALGFSGSAMVSASKIEDVFLHVKSMQMDFSNFRKVISSVNIGK
jgi:hypothetical protein